MTLYSVSGSSVRYYPSVKAATKAARVESADEQSEVLVEAVELVPFTKATIIRVLNQDGGYVERSFEIAKFQNGRLVTT